ncbi:hypothetical protein HNQ80_002387 [Anaerosolibacter carboniphilus]|uniref:Uncharacterized protein n=1 Tax=Anaerosolibacter carboniphilus TaxID=1417629 RepID=A0A841KVP0_9FIRM|nr:hypothetical protein [Anaerosolibacter carboniphilus]MBB6216288.1 hypothetical protein [Anaerosolibacter carboniphilus]
MDRVVQPYKTTENHVSVGNDAPIVPKKIGIQNHGTEGADPYEILYTLVGANSVRPQTTDINPTVILNIVKDLSLDI